MSDWFQSVCLLQQFHLFVYLLFLFLFFVFALLSNTYTRDVSDVSIRYLLFSVCLSCTRSWYTLSGTSEDRKYHLMVTTKVSFFVYKIIRVLSINADNQLSSSYHIYTENCAFIKGSISPCLILQILVMQCQCRKLYVFALRMKINDRYWLKLIKIAHNLLQNTASIQRSSPSICYNLVILRISTTPSKKQTKT